MFLIFVFFKFCPARMRGWTAVIGCREEDRGHHQRCGPTSLSPYLPESSPYIDGRLGHTGKGKVQKSRGGGDGWGWGGYRSPLWPRHHTIWFKTLSTLTLLALFHVSHTLTREVFEKLKTFPPTLFLPKMPTPASQNLFQNSHHRHRFHHHHHHHAQA